MFYLFKFTIFTLILVGSFFTAQPLCASEEISDNSVENYIAINDEDNFFITCIRVGAECQYTCPKCAYVFHVSYFASFGAARGKCPSCNYEASSL